MDQEDCMRTFQDYTREYILTAEHNDAVWTEFTKLTDHTPLLKAHRDWIEANQAGFGDRAFHAMWLLLLEELAASKQPLRFLEIGVYKGQVCSLWLATAAERKMDLDVYGISPLRGSGLLGTRIGHAVLFQLSRVLPAARAMLPDVYANADYEIAVLDVTRRFHGDLDRLHLLRGYSTNPDIQRQVAELDFDVVYIDGNHQYSVVKKDIAFYGERVRHGGYLVLDDASLSLPGTRFWKGHPGPSRAADELDPKCFRNVLNIGHNRVYLRV